MRTKFPMIVAAGVLFASFTSSARADLPLEKRVYTNAKGEKLPYRLLLPEEYDVKAKEQTKKYSLVVFLHGAGERGDNNEAQLVHGVGEFVARRKEYPCFLIAPQCPSGKKWCEVD
jgi:predicted peptidase